MSWPATNIHQRIDQLVVAEHFARLLGGDQRVEQIVARLAPPACDQARRIGVEILGRLDRVLLRASQRDGGAGDVARPTPELLDILLGDADQATEHTNRQLLRHRRLHVERCTVAQRRQARAHQLAHELTLLLDPTRRERMHDEGAQAEMLGPVLRTQQPLRHAAQRAFGNDRRIAVVSGQAAVAHQGAHLGVAQHRPDAERLDARAGVLLPGRAEHGVRILPERVIEDIDDARPGGHPARRGRHRTRHIPSGSPARILASTVKFFSCLADMRST